MMLKILSVKNFMAFKEAELSFCAGLNVIVGENGLGKTQLLKLPYTVMAVIAEESRRSNPREPTKALLRGRLAEKLIGVFRPESLGRLTRRAPGRRRCAVEVRFHDPQTSLAFNFATQNRSEVEVDLCPSRWLEAAPVYLPTRELLTIYPGFVSLYATRHLEFEETWRDTCLLLGSPTLRGPREQTVARLLAPLEEQIGKVVLDPNGRFYLRSPGTGNMEVPLVAEGWSKIATLVRLIATGSLLNGSCLFWDEPEANLNPKLVREVAKAILGVCSEGMQIFVATHSLFLMREFDLLRNDAEYTKVEQRYFALSQGEDGVVVSQGEIDEVGPLVLLDESLSQSDRYLDYQPER